MTENNSYKQKKYIKRTESNDVLLNFTWNKNEQTIFPNYSYEKVLDMVDEDPVARGALLHFVDKAMEGTYSIYDIDSMLRDTDAENELNKKFMFRHKVLRKIFLFGKLFNNVFLEIARGTDNKIIGLEVLYTPNIEPITEPNGKPIRYVSKKENPITGSYPTWDAKDVVWIKFGDRTEGFAPIDLKALWENLISKEYIRRYVAWLWKTGQYRVLYNFNNASDADINSFLAYARKHDEDFKIPFLMKGEVETKVLRDVKETDSIMQLLRYYDNQTTMLMRIPPVEQGMTDESGRSNADAMQNSLNVHITSMKKVLEDSLSYDLFPRMVALQGKALKFGPNDRFSLDGTIDIIQKMKAIGFEDEMVRETLYDKGMLFTKKKIFKEEQEEEPNNPKEKDAYMSRSRKNEGEASKRIGTGEQSSTRDEQIGRE